MAATPATTTNIEPLAQTPLAIASAAAAARDDPLPAELSAYRPNVSVLLVSPRHPKRVFCATRVDDPYKTWQCPQGGIDPGETALSAALRELEEETAVSSVRVVGASGWLSYDFPPWVREKLRPGMLKYKGQAQRWFLMLYTGDPGVAGENEQKIGAEAGDDDDAEGCAEVDLSGGGQHHREFSAWAWRPIERLPLDVSDFKRDVYAAVAKEFGRVLDELEAEGALRRVAEGVAAARRDATRDDDDK